MKTIQIGQHSVTAPNRGDLPKAKELFITAISQWTKLLFSTGDLVASEEGWDALTKLLALFPIVETKARVPLDDIQNDLERIERLFLSGEPINPDSVAYGLADKASGQIVPILTEKVIENYSTPGLLDLAGYQLWHVLPDALALAEVGAAKKD